MPGTLSPASLVWLCSSLKVNSSWRTAQRLTSSLYEHVLIHTDVIINKQVSLPFEYTKHLSVNLHTSGQFGDHSQCACHTDEMIHTSTTHRKMACVKKMCELLEHGCPRASWHALVGPGKFWDILEHSGAPILTLGFDSNDLNPFSLNWGREVNKRKRKETKAKSTLVLNKSYTERSKGIRNNFSENCSEESLQKEEASLSHSAPHINSERWCGQENIQSVPADLVWVDPDSEDRALLGHTASTSTEHI